MYKRQAHARASEADDLRTVRAGIAHADAAIDGAQNRGRKLHVYGATSAGAKATAASPGSRIAFYVASTGGKCEAKTCSACVLYDHALGHARQVYGLISKRER